MSTIQIRAAILISVLCGIVHIGSEWDWCCITTCQAGESETPDQEESRLRQQGLELSTRTRPTGLSADRGKLKILRPDEKKREIPSPDREGAPEPLSAKDRLAVINEARRIADLPPFLAVPPAHIVLSPSDPRSKGSYVDAQFVNFAAEGEDSYFELSPLSHTMNSMVRFHFNYLVPGDIYLFDCSVTSIDSRNPYNAPSMIWLIRGDFEETVQDEDGHLLVVFFAQYSSTTLCVTPGSWDLSRVHGAELTRVNLPE